ncbi:MAG: hypothetical protein QOI42_62 [Frankiaceae bacterium]|jgi:quinol monooxygenase YgiN|nr:hypothetical protein [Frankiaceae bacterium]
MYAVFRFDVPVDDAAFAEAAVPALEALRATTGCLSASLVRAVEDRSTWLLIARWEGVGAYRRALGSYDVKLRAQPFLIRARPEESSYEVIDGG